MIDKPPSSDYLNDKSEDRVAGIPVLAPSAPALTLRPHARLSIDSACPPRDHSGIDSVVPADTEVRCRLLARSFYPSLVVLDFLPCGWKNPRSHNFLW